MPRTTRRDFLADSGRAALGLVVLRRLPLPCGTARPLEKIEVAQIGCGRMGRNDVLGVLASPLARVVAVCDLDSKRLAAGKKLVEEAYQKQGESKVEVATYADYRELLARPGLDAVVVSVPDHWHARVAIDAALAGKHAYVQKPVTYDVAEAIALRTVVHARKIVLQTGSQQRSVEPWGAFRIASELVRNGAIGKLKSVQIGVGLDAPSGKPPAPNPVPENLDYERWLGAAPQQPYMEGRVHPQASLSGRPGWITTEDFGLGMITNWGAHHVDIAQWAMGQERGGPLTIEGKATFMQNDLWTVHRDYHVELAYPGDVHVTIDDHHETGLRFEGDGGWIFCTRSEEKATGSDPKAAGGANGDAHGPLRASDAKLLAPEALRDLGANAKRWPASRNHYFDWFEAIRDRREPVAPIDESSRSLTACYLSWLAMKLGRKLAWDPAGEHFVNDPDADARLGRAPRKSEYDLAAVLKRAGIEGERR
jgi:predicted dehydrogenase